MRTRATVTATTTPLPIIDCGNDLDTNKPAKNATDTWLSRLVCAYRVRAWKSYKHVIEASATGTFPACCAMCTCCHATVDECDWKDHWTQRIMREQMMYGQFCREAFRIQGSRVSISNKQKSQLYLRPVETTY